MKTIANYLGVVLVALLGLLLLALGVYELLTATSDIPTFRIVGIAPALLGVVLVLIAPLTKD